MRVLANASSPHQLSLHSSIPISDFRFLLLLRNDQNSPIQETRQTQNPHFFNRAPHWISNKEEEEEKNRASPQIKARDRPTNPNRSILTLTLFLFRRIDHPPQRVLSRWRFEPRPTLAWKAPQERRCRSSDYWGTHCSFFLVFVSSGRIDFLFDFAYCDLILVLKSLWWKGLCLFACQVNERNAHNLFVCLSLWIPSHCEVDFSSILQMGVGFFMVILWWYLWFVKSS